jgi:hypothetical protein
MTENIKEYQKSITGSGDAVYLNKEGRPRINFLSMPESEEKAEEKKLAAVSGERELG